MGPDHRSRIFNANCRNDILLHHIKSCCDCGDSDIIDLSDEKGRVKNLRNNLNDYGTDYLKRRESLILLRVDHSKGEDNQESLKFIPLLAGLKGNREFTEALNPIREETASSGTTNTQPSKTRRRSSIVDFNLEDLKNGKTKTKSNSSSASRKSISRRSTTRTLIKSK
ncbi:uncharacterized protein LOC124120316 isoform X2 [Haliotis rufescens]|uniref:uncharacterized protein LOC124120316 isoform X2 n=1 Tax=Haliotis rufescens TaxID=6454 RepID=UPI001EB060B6|nr:uncharacterized protein LOC124120316 isoform X2 [Haliotis rufescens]